MHIALIFNVMAYFVLSTLTGYQAWKAHEVVSQIIVNMIFNVYTFTFKNTKVLAVLGS